MPKWYEERGNNSDVVISTKVRLARNLKKYPFSTKISDADAKQLVEEVSDFCNKVNILEGDTRTYKLNELNETNRIALAERQIISSDMVKKNQHASLILREDEAAGIVINDEDHLEIQAVSAGMNIEDTYQFTNRVDDILTGAFEMAFDEKYGYLTTRPINMGTGLKVTYLLFLPALSAADKINTLVTEVAKYGVTIRGVYGKGEQNFGDTFMVTNTRTLGCSEQEILENLNTLVLQIIKQERVRREYVLTRKHNIIEDQVYRAYGVLKYTKQIDTRDAVTLISRIMFGVNTGVMKLSGDDNLYKMILNVQSNVLQENLGKNVGTMTRERLRAEYINQNLPELRIE